MKKIIVSITAIIFLASYSFGQNSVPKNNFSLSVGPSIPLGNFSSTDPNNELAGFAKTGANISLSWDHRLKKNFLLSIMLLGAENSLNTLAIESSLSKTGFFSPVYGNARYYGNWAAEKKRWYTGALLAGVSIELPLGEADKLFYLIKFVGGVAHLQYTNINADSKADTAYAVTNQTGGSGAFGFSYLFELGLKYKLNNKFGLTFKVNHFQTTKMSFNNINTTIAATNGGLVVPGKYTLSNSVLTPIALAYTSSTKQTVGLVNINLGVCYSF